VTTSPIHRKIRRCRWRSSYNYATIQCASEKPYHVINNSRSAYLRLSTIIMSIRNEKRTLLSKERNPKESRHVLVIHGGAGTILRERSSPEQQARYHAALRAALQAGNAILSTGGEAMDAVVAAIGVMEGKHWQQQPKGKLKPILDLLYNYQTIHSSTQARAPYSTRLASCVPF